MPSKIDWRLVLRGLFHQCRLGDCGVGRADFICRLNGSEVRGTAAGTPYRRQRVSIAVGVLRLGLPRLIEAFSRDAPSDRSPGWPSLLWVERLRTYALEHFGDDLQHVCRRKGPQRFRADVAQCAEASLSALGNIRTESLRAFSSTDMLKIVAKML